MSILNHDNALNQPTLTQLGNGTRTTREYFAWNAEHPYRLWKLYSGPDADTDAYQYYRYDYDAVGNITAIRDVNDSDQLVRFTYDALDRLTQAYTINGTDTYSHTYTYNQIGNLTAVGGVTQAYTDTAHIHAVRSAGSNRYQYDDRGNMTQRIVGANTWNYTYDQEGRLLTVSGPVTASYTYDAEGRLAKGEVGGVTSYYYNALSEQVDGTLYKWVWFGGQRVAQVSSQTVYLYPDHLGSTAASRTFGSGTTYRQRYEAFGAKRGTATVEVDYQYTGQRNEENLGIYHYGARWYDPSLGRFMQADSIVPEPGNPQSLNRYSYVLNNPLRYTDPTGHDVGCPGEDASRCGDYSMMIKMYAEMFGIPWEILLGLINSEVGLDTKFYDAAVNWLSSNYPELMALWPDPGPGIGNVHLSTASVVLKYMYDTYGDDLSLFYESAGKAGQIHFLANTEANTVVIAAYTRMLADYRFGSQTSHANLQDWELEDAVAVWHGYRYGVPKVSPAGQGFTSQEAFQTRHVGLAVLISEVVTGKGPEHGPGSPEESAGKGSNYLRTAWNPYYGIRQ